MAKAPALAQPAAAKVRLGRGRLLASARLRTLAAPPDEPAPTRWRTRGIALLLAFFLGGFGAHLFYLGYPQRGTLYLVLSLVGTALVVAGLLAFVAAIFGGGIGFAPLLAAGAIVLNVIGLLAFIDAIRILTDNLKPKDGEYYPRFFQTRPTPESPPAK